MALYGAWDVTVYDSGLSALTTNCTGIYLCSSAPTTYAQATTTYALGNKTGYTLPSPSDKSGGGREIICPAVSGGSITGTGTAGFYALVDSVHSVLLATKALGSSQAVTSGNTWSCAAFKQGIPAAA